MKYFLFAFLLLSGSLCAQTNQVIIHTTTNIIAPEEEDVQNLQNPQGGGFNFRNMMDGEFKSVTYVKNDLVKTAVKSEMGKFTVYRDNQKKITTTIMEMMGNQNGFYVTDEEQERMKQQRDSMMQERRKKDSNATQPVLNTAVKTAVSYTDETKKIAGFDCKKAYLITTGLLGLKDSAVIWVTNGLKVNNLFSTGGFSGMGTMANMMGGTLNGVENIDGFILRYEMKMRRNRRMEVEVTKVVLDKEIKDAEFEIPKDIEIKPMKEMRTMFGGPGMRGN